MSKNPLEYIHHIKDEAAFLLNHTRGLSKEDFLNDDVMKRAVVRSLEIIGEAVKNLPADFKERYPNVPWSLIARTRDKLIHHYFEVNYNIVWDILENEIPALNSQLDSILSQSPPKDVS